MSDRFVDMPCVLSPLIRSDVLSFSIEIKRSHGNFFRTAQLGYHVQFFCASEEKSSKTASSNVDYPDSRNILYTRLGPML